MGDSKNPRETAGCVSLLTFSWMSNVLKLGNQQPLEEKHIFPLEPTFRAEQLVDALEREWLAEDRTAEQNGKKPRLWRAMLRIFSCREYIVVAILRILFSFAMNLLPLALWFFLKNISSSSGTTNYTSTLPFMFCITVISLARAMFINHGAFKVEMMAYKLKVAVIGLVYKKILSLNRCALENNISENTINLVSNDAVLIGEVGYDAQGFLFVAVDIVVALFFLWYLVAWQALVGVSFLVLVSVYGSLAASKSGRIRKKVAAQTDKRLEIMKEIVSGIRVVKMYAWERNFRDLVAQIRRKEISLIRIRGFLLSSIHALFFTSHTVTGFISILALLLTGHSLSTFQVFTLLSILTNIKFFVTVNIGEGLHRLALARTACNRIQRFIARKSALAPNHLRRYDKDGKNNSQFFSLETLTPAKFVRSSIPKPDETSELFQPQVLLEDVSSFWNDSSHRLALQNVSLKATSGQLVGITGPVGSGKTSLLMTILGELPISSGQSSCFGKVAYVSQTPWVYSGTVRENIVFGIPFVEEKYFKIVEVCDLAKDLSSFPKGDLTEIGQRGVILSGGQRARVSLARALYSDADIFLLDDPLSAVDAKVGKHLFDRCIKEFLAGRVRILVTHHLQFLQHADNVVILQNGSVEYQGGYSQMDQKKLGNDFIASQGKQDEGKNSTITGLGEDKRARKANSVDECQERLNLAEEKEDRMVGTVKWQLYWKYFRAALPVTLIVALVVFFAIVQVAWIAPYWWISSMTKMSQQEQKNYVTLLIYGSIVTMSLLLTVVSSFCFYLATLKASENLHDEMTKAVIRAPVLFFDTNPVGRILNRFSKDIGGMDDFLPSQFLLAVQLWLYFFSATILSAVVNAWLLITCAPLTLLFMYLAKYYLNSSREIRRLEAITCSPVYSLIADTATGLEVIRSSGMGSEFLQKFYKYQDKNTSAMIMRSAAGNWLALRGELLSNFLVTSVSAGALFATQSRALAGMSLTYALDTLGTSQFGILVASETENLMTSVERVFTYTKIDPEPGYLTDTQAPEDWPKTGSLTLRGLSLAYFKEAPRILDDINVSVAAKEKVGVVGRTGAGKSSLVAALFRMPEPEGNVIIDGVNIRDLNLQAARRSMAVITQDPVLFSGSLRRNLDPFSLYKDHDLWSALEEVQLDTLVQKLPEQLEYKLRESGSNFSVGERQLVCLARALLQKSKIIILDEATANVDYKTDRLIQEVIRNRLKDSTVITIAHRLNTIMDYDKVLVMDQGRMVEFDKPDTLLQNSDGHFSRLVQTHNIVLNS